MTDSITFAIGDIHGCLDKLEALIAACELAGAGRNARIVCIGDYIDRGPDSGRVVDLLIRKRREDGDRFICLRGNHEEMLIRAADPDRSDRELTTWWGNGGERTLDSYGVNDPGEIPRDHLTLMRSLPTTFRDGKRLYVHAGIRPGVPLADQSAHDMLWIREPFLSSGDDHGVFVVHGHTPTENRRPDLHANRLNIDTGACYGGPLTAALFSDQQALPNMFLSSDGDFWRPNLADL